MGTAMNDKQLNRELFSFIEKCPNPYLAVDTVSKLLRSKGYEGLEESDHWELSPGGKYYVTRGDSSIIAFKLPEKTDYTGFQIMATHCDSPAFKLKPHGEMKAEACYLKLNTEKYGGMIKSTWLDRPLSIAGRICVDAKNGIETRLVNLDRDLCIIPSLAIHMDRSINTGYEYNEQQDMLPLFSLLGEDKKSVFELIADTAGVKADAIIDADLFLYNRDKGTFLGAKDEFIAAPRLDDLQCVFGALKGFLSAKAGSGVAVCAIFNNEEVGSSTKQGAASTFLSDTLGRINKSLGFDFEHLLTAYGSSFMISADNAHALHPNRPDKADPVNRPVPGKGIVIKYNAAQKYTTDALSASVLTKLCKMAKIPLQKYVNRSDIPGGSTLGSISNTVVSLNTVDIGLSQFAMHSAYETAGAADTGYLVKLADKFFSTSISVKGNILEIL